MKGERLVARAHAHPRSMGPKMDSLLYDILGSLLRNRFLILFTAPYPAAFMDNDLNRLHEERQDL
jgi:hypothetical protein